MLSAGDVPDKMRERIAAALIVHPENGTLRPEWLLLLKVQNKWKYQNNLCADSYIYQEQNV